MAEQEVQNGGGAEKAVEFTAVKPQLLVEAPKANDAVKFYKSVFGAEEIGRTNHPKRKAEQEIPLILSAELKLAGYTILVSDILADDDSSAPIKAGGTGGVVLCLETQDVDAAIAKAVSAGGVAEGEIGEGDGACCGGRVGKVKDPFGIVWLFCSPPTPSKKCDDVVEA